MSPLVVPGLRGSTLRQERCVLAGCKADDLAVFEALQDIHRLHRRVRFLGVLGGGGGVASSAGEQVSCPAKCCQSFDQVENALWLWRMTNECRNAARGGRSRRQEQPRASARSTGGVQHRPSLLVWSRDGAGHEGSGRQDLFIWSSRDALGRTGSGAFCRRDGKNDGMRRPEVGLSSDKKTWRHSRPEIPNPDPQPRSPGSRRGVPTRPTPPRKEP